MKNKKYIWDQSLQNLVLIRNGKTNRPSLDHEKLKYSVTSKYDV